jgi:hypothetical protein
MSAGVLASGVVSSLLSMVAWEGVHLAHRAARVVAHGGSGKHRR